MRASPTPIYRGTYPVGVGAGALGVEEGAVVGNISGIEKFHVLVS